MKRYPAFSSRISGAALSIVFTVVIGLADVWLVAWWIGSAWGAVVAAGTIVGLMLSIAWTVRHDAPGVSIGVVVTAVAVPILLSRRSPSAGLFSLLVALGVFGLWCLAYDVWFRRRHQSNAGWRRPT
jgi:hypothetical protein